MKYLAFFWVQIFIEETKLKNWRKKDLDSFSRAESGQNSWFLCDVRGKGLVRVTQRNHLFSRMDVFTSYHGSNSKWQFNPEPYPTEFGCVLRDVLGCYEKNVIFGPINLGISRMSVQLKHEIEDSFSKTVVLCVNYVAVWTNIFQITNAWCYTVISP